MNCKNNLLYFFAGAAALHTISHIWFAYSGLLPFSAMGFVLTPQINTIIMAVSAALTFLLLYLAQSSGQSCCHYETKEAERKIERERELKDFRAREVENKR